MKNENYEVKPADRTASTKGYAKRILWAMLGVGFVVALTLSVTGSVRAQVAPLEIRALAQGYAPEKEIELELRGPSDVLQSLLVFQPGGDTGWHTHPGPVIVVVKSGALTEYEDNGCVVVHPAGSVFFESKGKVHRAVNQTGVVSEVYATFLSPAGAQPLIPASDPGGRCPGRR
jgi:quercetin dioxygenase-like cupin family protein